VQDLRGSNAAVNALAFDRRAGNELIAGTADSQVLSWSLPGRNG
jgi:hypothetical protein